MPGGLAAVSIDLDEVPDYLAIHDLPPLDPGSPPADAVYEAALPRIAGFAAAHGLTVTLFAIGRDLERPANAAALRVLSGAGHAVENHSYGHRYDLVRLSPGEVREEIARGAEAIARATGRRPVGFRAPGYTVRDEVLDALEDLGAQFDSSVFPCPPYYAAKAAVLAAQRLRSRRSAAILDAPRVLVAPTRPYRPGRPWFRRGARRLIELPIQVTPCGRFPVIGTSVALAGPAGARLLAAACAREPLVNLELHGMDFLDRADGLELLAGHQPELRVPLGRRLDALSAFVEALARQGRSFVGLEEAAVALGPALGLS